MWIKFNVIRQNYIFEGKANSLKVGFPQNLLARTFELFIQERQ
jgi:hypothetical protein